MGSKETTQIGIQARGWTVISKDLAPQWAEIRHLHFLPHPTSRGITLWYSESLRLEKKVFIITVIIVTMIFYFWKTCNSLQSVFTRFIALKISNTMVAKEYCHQYSDDKLRFSKED